MGRLGAVRGRTGTPIFGHFGPGAGPYRPKNRSRVSSAVYCGFLRSSAVYRRCQQTSRRSLLPAGQLCDFSCFFSSKSRETSRSCASRHQRYGGKAFKRFARPRGGPGLVSWDDWPRSGVVREPPFSHVLAPDRGRLYLENGPGAVPRFSPVLPGPPRLPGGAPNRPVDACFPPPALRFFMLFSSKSRETSRSCASRHQRYGVKALKRFARPRGGPGLVHRDDWEGPGSC